MIFDSAVFFDYKLIAQQEIPHQINALSPFYLRVLGTLEKQR